MIRPPRTYPQQWEYYAALFEADVDKCEDELRQIFPGESNFLRFTPRALLPQMNKLGKEGWELVSIQPVIAGDNGDVLTITPGMRAKAEWSRDWTHTYLCAFKRAIPNLPPPE